MIHTVKGISIINEAEVDVILEFPCFLCDPTEAANLISGSSAFFISSLYIWKNLAHILLKPSLKNFKFYFASLWNENFQMYKLDLVKAEEPDIKLPTSVES